MVASRSRALTLLGTAFVVGALAGALADRAWMVRLAYRTAVTTDSARRANERRGLPAPIENDRIPMPLENLGLSDVERDRLRGIARRWRPKAAELIGQMRTQTSDIENDMFAEMLCVLTPDQRTRYRHTLDEYRMDRTLIEKRFAIVNADRCGTVLNPK